MNTMERWIETACCLALMIGPQIPNVAQPDNSLTWKACIVQLDDGRKVEVDRFWHIGEHSIEYERNGNLHDLQTDRIQRIECGDQEVSVSEGKLIARAEALKMSARLDTLSQVERDRRLFAMGREAAREHYRGAGAFAASLFTSPTVIAPVVIAAIPPRGTKRDPGHHFFLTEKQYRRGYRHKAYEKKIMNAALGMITGLTIILAVK